ncbi:MULTISPECIES: serine hydrolase [Lysinibacillus]|uniref:Class C beta-lactamase-related serine hydrolase n=1 Tax=Lysinibacillus antri TaxID=2498145 RepID=A0A3S0P416_9BACI|nr:MULTISPECIES: serine hydrolase [Lysinibacillus]RUL52160.1 class C beta-lactamase-related serine hydrolase [Lysinibacillus antri]TSI05262.1 serine hydrolase [Lysinibacillus sp. BW-2-10]
MEKTKVQIEIEQFFKNKVKKDLKIHNAYLRVHSEKYRIDFSMNTGKESIHPDQPFYIASISKLFTSVLFAQLIEQGHCSYEDKISKYLEIDILNNLHIYKGKDYTHEIKIKHLLNNTSGLHDFFEDKPVKGKAFVDLILDDPNRTWTPQEVIQWAKENLKTHFPPGERFHYSDTGYHLLGLIIEKITGLSFHEVLSKNIFEPLGMKHSHFSRMKPLEESPYEIAKIYMRNINVTHYQSMRSSVYAGGGIVSTTGDLLKFMKALVHYQLLQKKTIEKMKNDCGKFFLGIDYGYGVMNIKTIPLLMPAKYNSWGNAGSTGSFMFYHPVTDTYIIGTLNQSGYGQKGIKLMLQIADKILKAIKKSEVLL